MYDRTYNGKVLNFEPSGGLTNASLVMQDKQTDSYWSLMKGQALAGEMEGEKLRELPVGEKLTWQAWRTKYPNTKVLSVNSFEDGGNPYGSYFADSEGFGGLKSKDARLKTKDPIFAFHYSDTPYAVPLAETESGVAFELPDGKNLFLYRSSQDELFRSTSAFVSDRKFVRDTRGWTLADSEDYFDETKRAFDNPGIEVFQGFDTFWYNWSLNNPNTELLRAKEPPK